MSTESLAQRTVGLLAEQGAKVGQLRGIVGLDGFVDKIIRVVEQRDEHGASYFPDIPALAARIARAAGKSTALELHVRVTKLGGNGPIMANAMASYGFPLTYIGAIGTDDNRNVHAVFRELADRCEQVYSVCPAARTDALEFDDGKLMLQQMAVLDQVDYDSVVAAVGAERWPQMVEETDFLVLNHWASLPRMSDLWRRLQAEVCPHLSDRRRWLFCDLADPEKRSPQDIVEAVTLVSAFGRWYDCTLGLNEKESEHLCEALDCEPQGLAGRELIAARARALQQASGIHCVVVHPVAYAAAADARGAAVVDGPFTPKPLISTGAGDHFNAGFFLGRLLGGDLEQCLQCGVANSGSYVRIAKSPDLRQLSDFLQTQG